MAASAGASEVKHSKTGMTNAEMREFIRNHFEEFVNRKNLHIGETNFASGFVDHGSDVPAGMPPGPAGAIQYGQSGGAQPLDRHGCGFAATAGILRNRDLENRQPADSGALGLPGEPSPRARIELEV